MCIRDSNGDIEWTKNYEIEYRNVGLSLITTIDGGYMITGFTAKNSGEPKGILIKTDDLGNF